MAREDDIDDDRPRRPRRRDEDDDRPRRDAPPPKKSSAGMIVGIICGTILLICGGGAIFGYIACNRVVDKAKQFGDDIVKDAQKNMKNTGEANEARDRLKSLHTGLIKYHDTNGAFPTDTYDAAGKPLLSWRVHILPYMNQQGLYAKFKLDEPWDSPANRPLLREMPGDYTTGAARAKAGNEKTYFRGFSGPGAMFEKFPGPPANPPKGVKMAGVTDGSSNTILVAEAGEPIEWTKPDQLTVGQGLPALGGISLINSFFQVLMVNGEVKKVKRTVEAETFRRLVDRRDGDVIPDGWEEP